MMSKTMTTFGPWVQTKNVIVNVLAMVWDYANSQPYSEEEDSDYMKANKIIDDLLDLLKDHAVQGLKSFDEEVAESNLIDELKRFSKEAKVEADRIKKTTKNIEKFTEVLGKLTKVVEAIPGLPFI